MNHPMKSNAGRHAVVIGGSMAGLVTARVLADHFERVTLIERDHFPDSPQARKGVPQARHAHVLLASGRRIYNQLFPGLDAELAASGAPEVDWLSDCMTVGPYGQVPRVPSHLLTRNTSRDLLEFCVRRRVKEMGVEFIQGCDVVGLLSNEARSEITGVQLQYRRTGDGQPEQAAGRREEVLADFVVDASGRNSKTPQFLQALGYQPPAETVINSYLGYASRWYTRPAGLETSWKSLFLRAFPPIVVHGGLIFPIEQNRWIVTLWGVGDDRPPTDENGFMAYCRSLYTTDLYEAIKDAEPLTAIYGYQRTENRWRHYEHLARWPERFVAIGDAVCAFNPVYGQGMTAAALGAATLDKMLSFQAGNLRAGILTGLAGRFQKQLASVLHTPWLLATGEDFRYTTTVGGQPDRIAQLFHRYFDRIAMHSSHNPELAKLFLAVAQLIEPPSAFFQPWVILAALKPLPPQANELAKPVNSRVLTQERVAVQR